MVYHTPQYHVQSMGFVVRRMECTRITYQLFLLFGKGALYQRNEPTDTNVQN